MDNRIKGGKYRVRRLLGRGAFAEVYLVEDGVGREYACKVSRRSDLLEREAGYQRGAAHPLFPAVFDYWREEQGYLLMEYVRGGNLEEILRRKGPFSDRQAAGIGCRLAEGLGYLHEGKEPLLFRDVKPANVMLTPEGDVKLVDFGCVCPLGRNADMAGSPGFGAPEQFAPEGILTVRADVYGLGRTIREITGGKCTGLLKKVTDKCTEEEAENRLPDMWEAAGLLRCCTGQSGAGLSPRGKAILRGDLRILKSVCLC